MQRSLCQSTGMPLLISGKFPTTITDDNMQHMFLYKSSSIYSYFKCCIVCCGLLIVLRICAFLALFDDVLHQEGKRNSLDWSCLSASVLAGVYLAAAERAERFASRLDLPQSASVEYPPAFFRHSASFSIV